MTTETDRRRPAGEPRRRRSAEEARREILDAAHRRLLEGGPEAIRLQEIAADLSISHPAILHHFGSRDGLIAALDERAIRALTEDVAQALSGDRAEETSSLDLIERVAEAMEGQGLAQLIAWWAMRNFDGAASASIDSRQMIDEVATAILRRLQQDRDDADIATDTPQYERVLFAIRLALLATFGDAMLGNEISRSSGAAREAERHRFRAWLAELVTQGLPIAPDDSQ